MSETMNVDVRRAPRAGDCFLVMSDLITFKVTAADSGGRLTVVDVEVPPGGGPPPMHTHPPDEVFHVIEGEVTIYKGGSHATTSSTLRPGDSDHVTAGTPHTFRNLTERPARLLLVFSPAETMEQFFAEAGHPITDRSCIPAIDLDAEVPRVFEIGSRVGLEMLSPP